MIAKHCERSAYNIQGTQFEGGASVSNQMFHGIELSDMSAYLKRLKTWHIVLCRL